MKLLLKAQQARLLANGKAQADAQNNGQGLDFQPVVKLFTPDASATWLLSEIDPDNPRIAFGLCDLGAGFPELGSVSLDELEAVRGALGLPVERDRHFTAKMTLREYADKAHEAGRIVC